MGKILTRQTHTVSRGELLEFLLRWGRISGRDEVVFLPIPDQVGARPLWRIRIRIREVNQLEAGSGLPASPCSPRFQSWMPSDRKIHPLFRIHPKISIPNPIFRFRLVTRSRKATTKGVTSMKPKSGKRRPHCMLLTGHSAAHSRFQLNGPFHTVITPSRYDTTTIPNAIIRLLRLITISQENVKGHVPAERSEGPFEEIEAQSKPERKATDSGERVTVRCLVLPWSLLKGVF